MNGIQLCTNEGTGSVLGGAYLATELKYIEEFQTKFLHNDLANYRLTWLEVYWGKGKWFFSLKGDNHSLNYFSFKQHAV